MKSLADRVLGRPFRTGLLLWVVALFLLAAAPAPKPDDASMRIVHAAHYEIHTDLDETLAGDLAKRMDAMFDQYTKTYEDFKTAAPAKPAAPLPVYVFETQEKYTAFTASAGVNTGGLFVAGRHPYLTAYERGQGRDALRRTLQHEAFHQFAHAVISRRLPVWMNEGLAQYYEESIWDGKQFIPDQIPPRRVRQLKVDVTQNRLVEFDKFLAMTGKEWSTTLHSDAKKSATYYNQAWAMVYFCSTAGDAEYHKQFVDLLEKFHGDEATLTATMVKESFPDLVAFRKKFNAWAAKLKATPLAVQLEQQDTRADFAMAIARSRDLPDDAASFRDLVVKNDLKIQYIRGAVSYSTGDNPNQYFCDPAGKPYGKEQLFFQPDADAPLPRIIFQPGGQSPRFETHFYASGDQTEHETFVLTGG